MRWDQFWRLTYSLDLWLGRSSISEEKCIVFIAIIIPLASNYQKLVKINFAACQMEFAYLTLIPPEEPHKPVLGTFVIEWIIWDIKGKL